MLYFYCMVNFLYFLFLLTILYANEKFTGFFDSSFCSCRRLKRFYYLALTRWYFNFENVYCRHIFFSSEAMQRDGKKENDMIAKGEGICRM